MKRDWKIRLIIKLLIALIKIVYERYYRIDIDNNE